MLLANRNGVRGQSLTSAENYDFTHKRALTHLLSSYNTRHGVSVLFPKHWRDFATLGKLCDLPWPYLIAHHMGENFPLVDCI